MKTFTLTIDEARNPRLPITGANDKFYARLQMPDRDHKLIVKLSTFCSISASTDVQVIYPHPGNSFTSFVKPYLTSELNPGKNLSIVPITRPHVIVFGACQDMIGEWSQQVVRTHRDLDGTIVGTTTADPDMLIDSFVPQQGQYLPCTKIQGYSPCSYLIIQTFELQNLNQTPTAQLKFYSNTQTLTIEDGFDYLQLAQFNHVLATQFYRLYPSQTPLLLDLDEPNFDETHGWLQQNDKFTNIHLGNQLLTRNVYLRAINPDNQSLIAQNIKASTLFSDTLSIVALDFLFVAQFEICFGYSHNVYSNLQNLCDSQNLITLSSCELPTTTQSLDPVEIEFFESGTQTIQLDPSFLQGVTPCQNRFQLAILAGDFTTFMTYNQYEIVLEPIPETMIDQITTVVLQIQSPEFTFNVSTFNLLVYKNEENLAFTQPMPPILVQGNTNYSYQLNSGVHSFDLFFQQQFSETIPLNERIINKLGLNLSLQPNIQTIIQESLTLESQMTKISIKVDTNLAYDYYKQNQPTNQLTESTQEYLSISITLSLSDGDSFSSSTFVQIVNVKLYDTPTSNELLKIGQNKSSQNLEQANQDANYDAAYQIEIKNIWEKIQRGLSFQEWNPDSEENEVNFRSSLKSIDEMGIILVDFIPPILNITEDWEIAWQDTHLEKLTSKQRDWVQAQRKKILFVDYIQTPTDFEVEIVPKLIKSRLIQMSPGTIQIKIDFSDPLYVSESKILDIVRIFLNKGYFRVKKQKGRRSLQSTSINYEGDAKSHYLELSEIPKQVASYEQAQLQLQLASTITTGIQTQFVLSFVASFLMKGLLGFMWDLYNFMQILAAITLFEAQFPANVTIVADIFNQVSNLRLVNQEELYKTFFGEKFIDEQEKDKLIKQRSKVGSGSSFQDVLLYIIAIVILVTLIGFLTLIRILFLNKCCNCFKFIYLKIEHRVIFNSLLRSMLATYLSMCISVWFSFAKLGENFGQLSYWSSSFTVLMSLMTILAPILVYYFLNKTKERIREQEYRNRFGSLTQNLDHYKEDECIWWPTAFLCRRLLFAQVIVFGTGILSVPLQSHLGIFLSGLIAYLALKTKPMNFATSNVVMICNELVFGLLMICVLLFSNFIPNPVTKSKIGEVILILLAFAVFMNIMSTVLIQIKQLVQKLRVVYGGKGSLKNQDDHLNQFLKQKIKQAKQKAALANQTQRKCELQLQSIKEESSVSIQSPKIGVQNEQGQFECGNKSQMNSLELTKKGDEFPKLTPIFFEQSKSTSNNQSKLIQSKQDSLDISTKLLVNPDRKQESILESFKRRNEIQRSLAMRQETRSALLENSGINESDLQDLEEAFAHERPPDPYKNLFFDKEKCCFITKPISRAENSEIISKEQCLYSRKELTQSRQREQIRPNLLPDNTYKIQDEISFGLDNKMKVSKSKLDEFKEMQAEIKEITRLRRKNLQKLV